MAITPAEIRNKTFSIHRRGYDQAEVTRYLAAIADELAEFNTAHTPNDDIIVAEVVDGQEEVSAQAHTSEFVPVPTAESAPAVSEATFESSRSDEFDRVGTEISIMLRQAQESALKIRTDAEVEARTLVDQIRLDIEADRLAHEQAAGELISRTEERAKEVRTEAEEYSTQTRSVADKYATDTRQRADTEKVELTAAVEADRQLAADKLSAATQDADKLVADARAQADEILRQAQADSNAKADEILADARRSLNELLEAEKLSRSNLEEARTNIDTALSHLHLTNVDNGALGLS